MKQVISVGREINWIFNFCVEEETEKLHTHNHMHSDRDSGADVSGVSGEWHGESSWLGISRVLERAHSFCQRALLHG